MKKYAQLRQIENDRKITKETDGKFLETLEEGLLLALREQGYLSETQLQLAEEKLCKREER